MQSELNRQFNARLTVDGIMGPKTRSKLKLVTVRNGARGNITRVLQTILFIRGFNPGPFDGVFGDMTTGAVRAFQRDRSLSVDGIAGRQTWSALLA